MARRQFKDLCVLVVDDEEFIRSLVTRILTALEITDIEEASDGAEAIEKALAKTPDVVICDIEMEPVNGLEFLKRIRTAAAGLPRALPVIYLTGAQDGAIIGNAFALDPSAFVKKPSDLETLRDRIDRATGGHQAVQPPHAYEGVPTSAASPVRSVAAAEGDTRSE